MPPARELYVPGWRLKVKTRHELTGTELRGVRALLTFFSFYLYSGQKRGRIKMVVLRIGGLSVQPKQERLFPSWLFVSPTEKKKKYDNENG